MFLDSWEKDTVGIVEQKHGKNKIVVSFECETLKADKAAEDHIRRFMPKLAGLDAVGKWLCAHYSLIYISSKKLPLSIRLETWMSALYLTLLAFTLSFQGFTGYFAVNVLKP